MKIEGIEKNFNSNPKIIKEYLKDTSSYTIKGRTVVGKKSLISKKAIAIIVEMF